ncbi:unnamed protein product [Notodromas monacha]|uniref:Uncharacterized protein n=1 Tax=Notodromas monacha TaxID=399045 RepID=A0A7R9BUV5_9CRUS|nr:unnamed protein product [Notodromas monacha]CAG0921215.1 unnamed protein product [Notodromas monacha]
MFTADMCQDDEQNRVKARAAYQATSSNKPPVGDPNPNDIYKDLTHHEPQLDGNSRLLYKNLGILRYYIQDPEKADYLIVDKDSRVPNEVSNKDVAAAGPIGLPPAPRRQHSRPRNPQGLI